MSLQEMPQEVKRSETFWLYNEKVTAWLLITVLCGTMLLFVFKTIGRITWPAILILVPVLIMLVSKQILQKVHVSSDGVSVRKFGKEIYAFTNFEVGVFERRTGRRVIPYMYVKKCGFDSPYEFFQKVKSCSSDLIFFTLTPMSAGKTLAFLDKDAQIVGTGEINEKNGKILAQAQKYAENLRKSIPA